jgi:hypothetical protein
MMQDVNEKTFQTLYNVVDKMPITGFCFESFSGSAIGHDKASIDITQVPSRAKPPTHLIASNSTWRL